MAGKLPYVAYPSGMINVLNKIKQATTPERFTQDFIETKLGFKGGNYRQFIPLAKKLGLLNSDGTPTDLYKKFRNNKTSKAAMAAAIRKGYSEAFERNEYTNELSKEDFKGLVVEITGHKSNDKKVQLICQVFEGLKTLADFESKSLSQADDDLEKTKLDKPVKKDVEEKDFDLNLSYTINLVLPKTDDPSVFNAIFRSLRENLLRK